jgi:hypothetical protein
MNDKRKSKASEGEKLFPEVGANASGFFAPGTNLQFLIDEVRLAAAESNAAEQSGDAEVVQPILYSGYLQGRGRSGGSSRLSNLNYYQALYADHKAAIDNLEAGADRVIATRDEFERLIREEEERAGLHDASMPIAVDEEEEEEEEEELFEEEEEEEFSDQDAAEDWEDMSKADAVEEQEDRSVARRESVLKKRKSLNSPAAEDHADAEQESEYDSDLVEEEEDVRSTFPGLTSSSSSSSPKKLSQELADMLLAIKTSREEASTSSKSRKKSKGAHSSSLSSRDRRTGALESAYGNFIEQLRRDGNLEEVFQEPILGGEWLTLHRRLFQKYKLAQPVKSGGKSAKLTQNRVAASVGLLVRRGGVLIKLNQDLGKQYSSGASSRLEARIRRWLLEADIIEDEEDYDPARHSHSEAEMITDLYYGRHLDAVLAALGRQLQRGDAIEGLVLDVVSVPNTVCSVCHQSLDRFMSMVLLPTARRAFRIRNVPTVINASGNKIFSGAKKEHKHDASTWIESEVDFQAMDELDSSKKSTDARSARAARRRGASSGMGKKKSKGGALSAGWSYRRVVARAEELGYGNMVDISGAGLNCYIRSLVTGLALQGIIPLGDVENLVTALALDLGGLGLRFDGEMIDAGGLAAAVVRDRIYGYTGNTILPQIRIIQHDGNDVTDFVANQGNLEIKLLYTPGHFDLLL